jgi:hypothetical protein
MVERNGIFLGEPEQIPQDQTFGEIGHSFHNAQHLLAHALHQLGAQQLTITQEIVLESTLVHSKL